jgi:hypothetical protein
LGESWQLAVGSWRLAVGRKSEEGVLGFLVLGSEKKEGGEGWKVGGVSFKNHRSSIAIHTNVDWQFSRY